MKYDVILADPPWRYNDNEDQHPKRRHVTKKYSTLTRKQIMAVPVGNLAADNCALFMWATWPTIEDAFPVIEAWGFEYRTIAWVWVKLNKSSVGFFTGLGYYTRSNSEPCLLAVKGSMPPAVKNIHSLIVTPVRQHSRKPDEQYPKIEALYPDANKIELFARREHPGWDVWGNEVESNITMGDVVS